jgi:hypothetical protein
MKIVGRLAGVAAVAALLYGTTFFTRDRADPSWSGPVAKAVVPAKPAEGPAAARPTEAQASAGGSSQLSCAGQAWPKIAPECIAGADAAKDVRVIGAQGGPVPADRVRPSSSTQAVEPGKGEPVKPGAVRAAAADPDATGSLPVTSAAAEPAQGAAPQRAATQTQALRRAPRLAHAPARSESRFISMPAPALRQTYPAVALPTAREPIQFRLADRGH